VSVDGVRCRDLNDWKDLKDWHHSIECFESVAEALLVSVSVSALISITIPPVHPPRHRVVE